MSPQEGSMRIPEASWKPGGRGRQATNLTQLIYLFSNKGRDIDIRRTPEGRRRLRRSISARRSLCSTGTNRIKILGRSHDLAKTSGNDRDLHLILHAIVRNRAKDDIGFRVCG